MCFFWSQWLLSPVPLNPNQLRSSTFWTMAPSSRKSFVCPAVFKENASNLLGLLLPLPPPFPSLPIFWFIDCFLQDSSSVTYRFSLLSVHPLCSAGRWFVCALGLHSLCMCLIPTIIGPVVLVWERTRGWDGWVIFLGNTACVWACVWWLWTWRTRTDCLPPGPWMWVQCRED